MTPPMGAHTEVDDEVDDEYEVADPWAQHIYQAPAQYNFTPPHAPVTLDSESESNVSEEEDPCVYLAISPY